MAKVVALGPLEKRASRLISQAALFDLVQDMAHKVDDFSGQMANMSEKLDLILEILHGKVGQHDHPGASG